MIFKEFIKASERNDKIANDNTHYFSTIFAKPISFFLYKIKLTPNFVTFLFLIAGIFSGIFFFFNYPILGYIFWRLHIILDMADGSIARATKNYSIFADGFDKSNHILINTLILLVSVNSINNIYITYFILVSFYLYYLFDRFYFTKKSETRHFSLIMNCFKDFISLELYFLRKT